MDKRHSENIVKYIQGKLQRAENYIDSNAPELALDLVADIEKDINKGVQTGLLSNPEDYRQETKELVRIRDRAASSIRMDSETTSRLNRNERRIV